MISGSIGKLGSQYVLGLKAVKCRTGDGLGEEQETASGKEKVLAALDQAAIKLRKKLGESLNTAEKFDTPLEQTTTLSLEALQAYSMRRKVMSGQGEFAAAIPFFQQAIRIDPNFTMAYATMGSGYFNLGESKLGAESVRRAYELRGPVSQVEKSYIESIYYSYVVGNLEKARQTNELSARTYPRYYSPQVQLCVLNWQLGQYDKALEEIREAVRLEPSRAINAIDLVSSYIYLNRLKDARATADEALAKHLDSPFLHVNIYRIAFLQDDAEAMVEQVRWANGKPGIEDVMLESEAETSAYFGYEAISRDLRPCGTGSGSGSEKRNSRRFLCKSSVMGVSFGKQD